MKSARFALSAIVLVAVCAGSASAECEFNGLAKAKGMKTSMVRSYAGCPSSEHPTINSETGGGTPACSPVVPTKIDGEASPYRFDPVSGGCDVQTRVKLEPDCSLLTDGNGDPYGYPHGPCHVTYVKSKCKGILREGGTSIDSNDAGWALSILVRATVGESGGADMTLIDLPKTFAYSDPKNGRMQIRSSTADWSSPIWLDPPPLLPPCTTLQILKVTIKDPNGLPFATMGGSTRP